MDTSGKIFVAGGRGMVGSSIIRQLQKNGFDNIISPPHKELDLTRQQEVEDFFKRERPRYVFLSAAKVGGIWANSTYPGEFIYSNLCIEVNIIEAARLFGVEKLLFMGSSCIYPRNAPQPMKEEYLLTGILEPTNQPYAVAKISGIIMCQAYNRQYDTRFHSCMPTNLYGPGDNYELNNAHVIPSLIRRFHEAKVNGDQEVVVWGTGSPLREFLHVDDLGAAALMLMQQYDGDETINVGSGEEVSIKELAELVRKVVGFPGELVWDAAKPDGTPRKLLDSSRIRAMGYEPSISLEEGLAITYQDFLANGTRL